MGQLMFHQTFGGRWLHGHTGQGTKRGGGRWEDVEKHVQLYL